VLHNLVASAENELNTGTWTTGTRKLLTQLTLGNLFTPNVPLFTKQYNLVPCEGFHANAP